MKTQIKNPNRVVLTLVTDNYKKWKELKTELFTNANALWAALPNDIYFPCKNLCIEIDDETYYGIIIAFENNANGSYAVLSDYNSKKEFYIEVHSLPTDVYLRLANFVAKKYLEKCENKNLSL